MSTAETSAIPVPHRLDAIETVLQTITGTLDKLGGVVSALIPAAAPVVATVDAVGHVAEEIIDRVQGDVPTLPNAAALAAGQISKSTGNASLDARLSQIELLLDAAVPVLRYLAPQFGMEFAPATAAPMTAAVSVQGETVNAIGNDA